jgi:hypothetical protein
VRAAVDAEVTQLSQRIRALNNQIISDREYLVQLKHNLDDPDHLPHWARRALCRRQRSAPLRRAAAYDHKARRRRAELQASIERTADEIVARVLGAEAAGGVGWTDAVESIRQDLRSRVPDEQVLNSMAEELALLEAAQHDLNAVLAEAPSR